MTDLTDVVFALDRVAEALERIAFELVEDAHHAIWFTEAGSDKIGVLQP